MKKYLTTILKIALIVITSLAMSGNFALADVTNTFWTQPAAGVLMTNTPGGLATADIHVANCYIGTGTSIPCNGSGGIVNSIVPGTNVTVDNTDPANPVVSATFTQTGKYWISGGAVWSGTGYVYNVSAINYFFDGFYTSSPTTITFAAPDPTYDRLDAVVVDQTGTVSIVEGTAAADPIAPVIPDTDLLIQYELVEHGTTQPTVTVEPVYKDYPTTNWTAANYTTSGTPVGSTNFAATNSCYQGTTCIDNLRDGRTGDRFTRASNITLANYTVLTEWVRFSAPVAANKSLNVNWQTSTGANVGSTLNLFNYGISRTVTNTWQLALVPVTAFGSITQAEKLDEILAGGTNGVTVEWDLDYILLQNGAYPIGNAPTVAVQKDNVGVASQGTLNFLTTSSVIPTVVNDPLNNRINISLTGPISSGTGTQSGSNFIGSGSGQGATYADESFFAGTDAGFGAINADHSTFIGDYAGYGASGADHSAFIGSNAGYDAYNASNSAFIGFEAGEGSQTNGDSINIGYRSGYMDTNSNPDILLGSNTHAGTFNNVIAFGVGSTVDATSNDQVTFDPLLTQLDFRGVDWTMPSAQGAAGTVLTNDGSGNLTWTPKTTVTLPAYASDAAAGSAGLTAGQEYQTNGAGTGVFAFTGVVMVKQ